jgi:hypothetical protein
MLEDYTEYHQAKGAPGDGSDPDPEKLDREYRIYAQNKQIDEGMRDIKREYHRQWDILHGYYRMGLWCERKGWHKVAVAMLHWQLPQCPGPYRCCVPGDDRRYLTTCPVGDDCCEAWRDFDSVLDEAIEILLGAIEDRGKE